MKNPNDTRDRDRKTEEVSAKRKLAILGSPLHEELLYEKTPIKIIGIGETDFLKVWRRL